MIFTFATGTILGGALKIYTPRVRGVIKWKKNKSLPG
jgi:hypothetical protein